MRWGSANNEADDRPICVLLADDQDDLREVVSEVLGLKGFKVCPARAGDEAFTNAIAECPDVLILNVKLPVLDGPEVVRALRRLRHNIPTILMSASDDAAVAANLGIPFLLKPFATDSLIETILAVSSTKRIKRRGMSS